jgi:hypothetical protein
MEKSLDKPLFDYSGKQIPQSKRAYYYEHNLMSIESMREYEVYKQEIIKQNEKSARDFMFQEKDKVLFSISKKKPKNNSA